MVLDDDQSTSHSVPAKVKKAVEQNKRSRLSELLEHERSQVSDYGVDLYGRRPGDENYGAYDSDEMIAFWRRNGVQNITWGVVKFETLSSSELEEYMKEISKNK